MILSESFLVNHQLFYPHQEISWTLILALVLSATAKIIASKPCWRQIFTIREKAIMSMDGL